MFWLKNKKVNYILLFRAMLQMCNIESSTVKSVLRGHSKIDKTKVLTTNGSLMKSKVLQNACHLISHSIC